MAASIIQRAAGLPFDMPRIWYVQPNLCFVLALLTFLMGCMLVKQTSIAPDPEKKTASNVRFASLKLYTRKDCQLCEDAKSLLLNYRQFLPDIDEIDIDEDPALQDQFSTCVPVVEIDGKIRFRGGINEMLLKRLVDATTQTKPLDASD